MKTPIVYGLYIALAGALLNLILFFAGFHTDAEKVQSSQTIGSIAGLVIGIGGLVVAQRARRAEIPAHEPFGYGRAFGAGFVTGLSAAIFGAIFTYIYFAFVNPGLPDLLAQNQQAQMAASGMNQDTIDATAKATAFMMKPPVLAGVTFFGGVLMYTVLSLITSIFVKRPAAEPPPVAAAA